MANLLSSKEIARADQVLKRHSLKKTALRRSILLAFLKAKGPLTQADLIETLSDLIATFDRVSVYRNLAHLKEAGILHELETNKYVFCSHECDSHGHLLLYCLRCQKHQEITDHPSIAQLMTAVGRFGFFSKGRSLFLKGVCSSCSPRSQ